MDEREVHYSIRGGAAGLRGGAHASRASGSLGRFRDTVPFMAFPDARRIDVRATVRDPFEVTVVRRFQHLAALELYAVVDLSGSMGYQGRARKIDLIAALVASLAHSATRLGDRFGLIGCAETMLDACYVAATRRRGVGREAVERLQRAACRGASAAGLLQAADRLAGARKLVFLVSDFLLPLELLRRVYQSLARHDIVSVMVRDSTEDEALPDWGLIDLVDLETGARRVVFMRPALKQRWLARDRRRRDEIARLAQQYGRSPVLIADRFDAERFSRDLFEA